VRPAGPRPSRSPVGLLLLAALLLGACATVAPRGAPSLPPEAEAARAALERRWQTFTDLRTLVAIEIRRGGRTERLSGPLLLRSPSSLRFEALSPFGPPVLVVGVGDDGVVVWEVIRSRAYRLPATPEANRRWLGVALGGQDLVALLAGHVLPMKDAQAGELLPGDANGPSLSLTGPSGTQRIWMDVATGHARKVTWTGGKQPLDVVFAGGGPTEPITGLTLTTPDGRLEARMRYQNPRFDAGFDPGLLRVDVPQAVEIQDFR
jgi:outer membrane lipoprotein-sorting protein